MLEHRDTTLGDYRIHSVHLGRGTPLLLLHGLSGSHRWWLGTAAALAAHRAVHVPDLIGFGGSRPARVQPSIPAMAELVCAWAAANGLDRFDLAGHSMGGQIAIHIAAEHPERVLRLVLVSAAGIPRVITLTEATRFVAEVLPPRAWGSPRFLPVIARDALRSGALTIMRATRNLLADDVRPLLPKITAPTLVVWGRHDPLTPLAAGREIAALIPHAQLVVLDGAAHVPMADAPERFLAAVQGFLA